MHNADGASGLPWINDRLAAVPARGGTTQSASDSKRPRSLSIRQLATLGGREPRSPMMMYDSSGQAQWRSRQDGSGRPVG